MRVYRRRSRDWSDSATTSDEVRTENVFRNSFILTLMIHFMCHSVCAPVTHRGLNYFFNILYKVSLFDAVCR